MISRVQNWTLVMVLSAIVWMGTGRGLQAQTKLLRFPDLHGNTVVFTYAGDLWTAPASGGLATRVTVHPGLELFAKFSPDGKQLAFTGQYDGDEQVYVIPATGGEPRQLTYYPARGPLPDRWGYDNQVYGWTGNGKSVVFRSMREGWTLTDTRLYTVATTGGLPQALPMPVSGGGALSPDGTKVVYSPLTRDFRTWKRYQGGWAQDLFIFDLATSAIEPVAHSPRTERDPMWIGDKIYFASDRTGTLNLFEFDPRTKAVKQLTKSTEFDVRWPSAADDGRIVYELGGELYLYDIAAGQSKPIPITVPTDALARRPSRMAVTPGLIEDFSLSPKGERALFVGRGDIFSAPIEKGVVRNLTRSSGAHDKAARWSPDGSKIAYLSDATGEEELYLVDQEGTGKPEQLTQGGKAMRYAPAWSPDGKRLAFSDKDGKIFVLTLADKSVVQIADEARGQVDDYTWSPCSTHLAFSLSESNDTRSLFVWSVGQEQPRRVSHEIFDEFDPAWDPDGNYLFFLSRREFAPQGGGIESNFLLNRSTGIFALALRKDVKNPFPPESDEVKLAERKDDAKEADKAKEKGPAKEGEAPKEKAPIVIDFDGLAERVVRVPVAAENYGGLAANKGHLLYIRRGGFYYGREAESKPELRIFSLADRKETVLAEGADDYALSFDGSKLLVKQGPAFHLHDASPKGKDGKKPVSIASMAVDRVPAQEWEQIFDEVWRRFRDFFYVDNIHGYDWDALRSRYRPLLAHVAHRSDLNYVIGEMISELNVGHAYNSGGDWEIPKRPQVALPGAEFTLDAAAGRYKISRILKGQNEEGLYRSPLTEVGVDVKEGDYVLAIDGEELAANDNPYRLLRYKADRPVQLMVNAKPEAGGARTITFQPISSETDLRYLDYITTNRDRVTRLSEGRLGYIHIPNMGPEGIREFIKWYYPQIRKEGLVVDVRSNGGGNVSQILIERLRRELLATGFARTNDSATTYPSRVFHGHLVCLLNQNSASDGDIFPAMFKQAKLGLLIGKRSWGGVIGITNRGPLVDGGTVNVPEFGFASADGRWIIEGYGVDPDIDLENDPKSVIAGRDLQLERAVEEVLKKIREQPKRLPERPAPPVKTK
ncbi:MAG: PD40 domain-containing protein [Planctomycetes bacterium]|nr:PD40 domain-containing protein [Planctomycetota bacterium]